jgi:hypothetical protein
MSLESEALEEFTSELRGLLFSYRQISKDTMIEILNERIEVIKQAKERAEIIQKIKELTVDLSASELGLLMADLTNIYCQADSIQKA